MCICIVCWDFDWDYMMSIDQFGHFLLKSRFPDSLEYSNYTLYAKIVLYLLHIFIIDIDILSRTSSPAGINWK